MPAREPASRRSPRCSNDYHRRQRLDQPDVAVETDGLRLIASRDRVTWIFAFGASIDATADEPISTERPPMRLLVVDDEIAHAPALVEEEIVDVPDFAVRGEEMKALQVTGLVQHD